MAFRFVFEDNVTPSVNLSPATPDAAVWNLIRALVAAGWRKIADSDGTTYSATGAQVTGAGSGAHGLANVSAWVRLTDPANGREWCFQRIAAGGATGSTWRIKVSPLAKFTGGTPGATQVASASDEKVLWGGGTDGSPTGAALSTINAAGYRQNIGCDAAAPYSFYSSFLATGGASQSGLIYQDGMLAGSYPPAGNAVPGDADPMVYQVSTAAASTLQAAATGPAAVLATTWTAVAYGCLSNTDGAAAGGLASNPFSGLDDLVPLGAYRYSGLSTPNGWKGFSTLWKMCGANRACGLGEPIVNATNLEVERRVTLDSKFTLPFPVGVAVQV